MASPVYLDHNATTPVAPEVLEAMLPWLRAGFGNPASDHPLGRAARAALEQARAQAPSEAVSVGSACHAGETAVSGVLAAMGLEPAQAQATVRLSLGAETRDTELDSAAAALIAAWRELTLG